MFVFRCLMLVQLDNLAFCCFHDSYKRRLIMKDRLNSPEDINITQMNRLPALGSRILTGLYVKPY